MLKLFKFSELTADVQRKVIRRDWKSIQDASLDYLYNHWIPTQLETSVFNDNGFDVRVDIREETDTLPFKITVDVHQNGEVENNNAEERIVALVNALEKDRFYFAETFRDELPYYNGGSVMQFIKTVMEQISRAAYAWYINMTNSYDYAMSVINGSVETPFADEEYYYDNTMFSADGIAVKVPYELM